MSEVAVTGAGDEPVPAREEFARDTARSAEGLLAELNHPDGLSAADVHVARRLARLGGCDDEKVLVAAALAVRAVRQGSVCLDLASDRAQELLGEHAWDAAQWRAALLASSLVREAADDAVTPLVLDGDRLYLDRYWGEEGQVVRDLQERRASAPEVPDGVGTLLDRYFPDADDRDQRAAAEAACGGWTTVVTGGPGTGKTTTIARLLGVLLDADPGLRVALAAPTGRAAARMSEAIAAATARADFPDGPSQERIRALRASTLHRLLGWQPGRGTFRHGRANRLPYDVVVVDETSMVSLTLMARLLDAVRPHARLVLMGDADQLASVDAGAVLGDLVRGLESAGTTREVRTLTRSYRFGGRIATLSAAIRDGQQEEAVRLLTEPVEGVPEVELLTDPEAAEALLLGHALALREAALEGDAVRALALLGQHRLLCAHREGPYGAGHWNRRVERALAEQRHRYARVGTWYVGRPVIVTENDYGLGLFNGDLGVVVSTDDGAGMSVVMDAADPGGVRFAVGRLPEVRSAHAMTVHRSQGSQVEEVTVLLPDSDSPLLTRQLLYTAVTRAKARVRVVGSPDAVRTAVGRDVQRASGLAERLATLPT